MKKFIFLRGFSAEHYDWSKILLYVCKTIGCVRQVTICSPLKAIQHAETFATGLQLACDFFTVYWVVSLHVAPVHIGDATGRG